MKKKNNKNIEKKYNECYNMKRGFMKKIALFFFIVIAIVVGVAYSYINYKSTYNQVVYDNKQFESYYNQEVYGTDLATIINRAIDKNIENDVRTDEKGFYIENETNSIKIDIKITDNDSIYEMETFYKGETSEFVKYYGGIKFKCVQIDYHKTTGKVKYLLFEQITE